MDLLTREDVKRNKQVIFAGYGRQNEWDNMTTSRNLKFIRQNMFVNETYNFNKTIAFKGPFSIGCPGMS